jgi:protein-S-isoprenylcysteine O-methyltransferase Ste14
LTFSFPQGGAWTCAAIGYHLASRLAYVVGIGVALIRQDRDQYFTRRLGVEAGYQRFRRWASVVMNNDAVSFVVLCLVTRQTLPVTIDPRILIGAGVLGIVAGLGIKSWAALRLGSGAYYWRNFFVPGKVSFPDPPGPYRYLENPMYTLGYLHAYGFALLSGSLPGLIAAAFDQASILLFLRWVEKPHFERLTRPDVS